MPSFMKPRAQTHKNRSGKTLESVLRYASKLPFPSCLLALSKPCILTCPSQPPSQRCTIHAGSRRRCFYEQPAYSLARRLRAHGTPVSFPGWQGFVYRHRLTRNRYKHRLTKARENLRVNECRGGLLADEMGMGKSLSVLTLIVHTLEAAQRFEARRFDDDGEVPTRQSSGATLIAAPKSSTCETLH